MTLLVGFLVGFAALFAIGLVLVATSFEARRPDWAPGWSCERSADELWRDEGWPG